MEISEQELRAMVRDAIARQAAAEPPPLRPSVIAVPRAHASHGLLALLAGGDDEGRCLIEPAVGCNHCGYCQSMGH